MWKNQPRKVIVWVEKDALSGVFDRVVSDYRISLYVGRGYDSWSALYNAAQHIGAGNDTVILYYGDFDPSGLDIDRSLRERLCKLGCKPTVKRMALTTQDIATYQLPPMPVKTTDRRHKNHINQHGDVAVELDALDPRTLQARIRSDIEQHIDMKAFAAMKDQEYQEQQYIKAKVDALFNKQS